MYRKQIIDSVTEGTDMGMFQRVQKTDTIVVLSGNVGINYVGNVTPQSKSCVSLNCLLLTKTSSVQLMYFHIITKYKCCMQIYNSCADFKILTPASTNN